MKRVISVFCLVLLASTANAKEYIDVKFTGGIFSSGDGCPRNTEIKDPKFDNEPACYFSKEGTVQGDGFCASRGEPITWKGNKAFTIVDDSGVFGGSCTYSSNGKEATCTVKPGIPIGAAYKYSISATFTKGKYKGKTCVLDPRIIVNDGR